MPRNVRNFWLELSVDGSQKTIATGPRNKDGGFTLTILQRDKGDIVRAMEVWGRVSSEGKIVLSANLMSTPAELKVITER